jgi:hypothetical protein
MLTDVRTFGTLLAATLLTLCVGLQVLEASGQWDRTLKDAGDEATIVTIVLCIGSGLVAARLLRQAFSVSPLPRRVFLIAEAAHNRFTPPTPAPACSSSPPVSLRI